eukprot:4406587-Pleurochrysis_carterae.AAC.3
MTDICELKFHEMQPAGSIMAVVAMVKRPYHYCSSIQAAGLGAPAQRTVQHLSTPVLQASLLGRGDPEAYSDNIDPVYPCPPLYSVDFTRPPLLHYITSNY